MYESEDGNPGSEKVMALGQALGQACRVPANQFRTRFDLINSFEKGIGVAVNVDGILCLSKEDAAKVFTARLDELWGLWEAHVKKNG